MIKKIIITLMSIFMFIGISLASTPLDSAWIASKLKKYEMFRAEYQYDSLLYITNTYQGYKAAHVKIVANLQTAEKIEAEGFEKNYKDNSWNKVANIINLFDENGNTISQINLNNDSTDGDRIDYVYNKDGLKTKVVEYELINNNWVVSKSTLLKYGVLGDTISVIDNEESITYYYNDATFTSYNIYGNWVVLMKQDFEFNEDGSIHTMKLISEMNKEAINEFHFYYKTKTETAKTFNLTNYSLRNKHLYIESKTKEKLRIYNISGKLVATKINIIGENIHDLSFLASGVYVLKTESSGSGKIILR